MKKYIINGKIIEIDEATKKQVEGITGDVYPLGNNRVLKVLNGEEDDLDKTTAEYLTHQKASRILLPIDIAYDISGKDFKGYVLSSRVKPKNGQSIIHAPKRTLVRNLELLEGNISKLSAAKVSINTISPENAIFNGKLYLTDPRSYSLRNQNQKSLELENYYQLNILLARLIGEDLQKTGRIDSKFINEVEEFFKSRDYNDRPSQFFDELLPSDQSVRQYIKTNFNR